MENYSIKNLKFIPGLELNQKFYAEVVGPLLDQFDPRLRYSTGLIGYGSDVLGFDNATSMDHNWGPRGQLFVEQKDARRIDSIREYLRSHLPGEFLGFPTNFTDIRDDGTQSMTPSVGEDINSLIEIHEVDQYFGGIFHKDVSSLTPLDWLCVPEQKLLEITSGRVFHDGLNRLDEIRTILRYYPHDIRLVKLAAYWNCISNEEAFIGRAVELNDLLNIKLIAPRLVNTLLKICFVLKERYVPYSKWFSRGFEQLNLEEIRQAAVFTLGANEPGKIESRIADLYMFILKLQNETAGIPRADFGITAFYNRPYKVIMAEKIVSTIRAAIHDDLIRDLDLIKVGLDNKLDGLDLTNGSILEELIRE